MATNVDSSTETIAISTPSTYAPSYTVPPQKTPASQILASREERLRHMTTKLPCPPDAILWLIRVDELAVTTKHMPWFITYEPRVRVRVGQTIKIHGPPNTLHNGFGWGVVEKVEKYKNGFVIFRIQRNYSSRPDWVAAMRHWAHLNPVEALAYRGQQMFVGPPDL